MTNNKNLKVLLEYQVKKALYEISGKTPNIFWLVTGISEKTPERLKELSDGVLQGVKGISDNKKILMHWLGVGRNAVLVMSTSSVLDTNSNLHKIHYNKPDELLKNDMELLSRIWNKERSTEYGRRAIMINLSFHITKLLRKSSDRVISGIASGITSGIYDIARDIPEINSISDLANHIQNRILEDANEFKKEDIEKLPFSWWEGVVKQSVLQAVKSYETEGEWIVSDEVLKIPNNSKLLVAVEAKPKDFPEEVREQLKTGEFKGFKGITQEHIQSAPIIMSIYRYELDVKYDVRFIDMNKFREIQRRLQSKHIYG